MGTLQWCLIVCRDILKPEQSIHFERSHHTRQGIQPHLGVTKLCCNGNDLGSQCFSNTCPSSWRRDIQPLHLAYLTVGVWGRERTQSDTANGQLIRVPSEQQFSIRRRILSWHIGHFCIEILKRQVEAERSCIRIEQRYRVL